MRYNKLIYILDPEYSKTLKVADIALNQVTFKVVVLLFKLLIIRFVDFNG